MKWKCYVMKAEALLMLQFILVPLNLIEVTKLPEKNQQLLVELDLLGRIRQISLSQRICQQASKAFQYKVEVLQNWRP